MTPICMTMPRPLLPFRLSHWVTVQPQVVHSSLSAFSLPSRYASSARRNEKALPTKGPPRLMALTTAPFHFLHALFLGPLALYLLSQRSLLDALTYITITPARLPKPSLLSSLVYHTTVSHLPFNVFLLPRYSVLPSYSFGFLPNRKQPSSSINIHIISVACVCLSTCF